MGIMSRLDAEMQTVGELAKPIEGECHLYVVRVVVNAANRPEAKRAEERIEKALKRTCVSAKVPPGFRGSAHVDYVSRIA
jgi:hypothetical protein